MRNLSFLLDLYFTVFHKFADIEGRRNRNGKISIFINLYFSLFFFFLNNFQVIPPMTRNRKKSTAKDKTNIQEKISNVERLFHQFERIFDEYRNSKETQCFNHT